jgi:Flp pilus assembly pilin Flp
LAKEEVMKDLFRTLWRDDSGQDTTEYVLLVLLVALAVTAGMILLATEINAAFSEAGNCLDAADPSSCVGGS